MSVLSRDLLDPDELERLLDACGDGDAATRNRALLALMASTGLRVSEALAIESHDLDLRRRRLHVRRGIGGRERLVWIHLDAVKPVRAWCRARRRLALDEAVLFCSMQGAPLSPSYVRGNLPRLGQLAGIEKRVYADGLRHVFAARAYEAKITTRSLQVQFGHENISATVAYLERLGLHEGFAEFDRAFA